MATPRRKRLIFHWTTPKNLLAILLFITLVAVIEYVIITFAISTGAKDPTANLLPLFNISISLLYHFVPIVVILTLTTCFLHLTTQIALFPKKSQIHKKPSFQKSRQKTIRLKYLRQFYRKLGRAARNVKNRILKTPGVAYIEHRIILAKAIIKSAATITVAFIIMILLITVAAYPKLVPSITVAFYQWNNIFLNFVTTTIKASETIANTISPIGAIANAIHNALLVAAPTFHITLKGAASALTSSIVALDSTEKYLITQNIAAWTIALATLLYSQYVKTRARARYRR